MNLFKKMHELLMHHCDGSHADRFTLAFAEMYPGYNQLTEEGHRCFISLPEHQQAAMLADFWIAQFQYHLGQTTTPEYRNRIVTSICEDMSQYMFMIIDNIEAEDLPRLRN